MNYPINTNNSSVTMSLSDYENVRNITHNYKALRQQIKLAIADSGFKGKDVAITVDTVEMENLIKSFVEDDMRVKYDRGFKDARVTIHWE